MVKRIFDIFVSVILIIAFLLPSILIIMFLFFTNRGQVIHWSKRVGRNNQIFLMPKFKTMKSSTPELASHLLKNPENYLIFGGALMRKLSLDELPQLFSVLRGDMSIVGPRPALFNQDDLMDLRTKAGIHILKPGVTGWAQVNGRDEIDIKTKVEFEEYYLKNQSILLDLKICILTFYKVLGMKNITH